MDDLTPAHIAAWDQSLQWVDDELDFAFTLFNSGDYDETQVDVEGRKLAERIQALPTSTAVALIPIVMSRANMYRTQVTELVKELHAAMKEPVAGDNGYVSIDRLTKIIERNTDVTD